MKILLIGDSCTDEYKNGTIDRLSPEAPVPVFKLVETKQVPGMASNVNLNLINLGMYPYFVHNKEEIVKTRFIDQRSGQHIMRLDIEPEVAPWDQQLPAHPSSFDAIVISDYDKGFLTYEAIEKLLWAARCPVFIDTKKTDLSMFVQPNVFVKINKMEFDKSSGAPSNLIVTLGGDGVMYNNEIYPTKKVEVMDVCGCGDTFLSALTTQYLYTRDIEKSIMFANIAAGITVQHRGNYAPTYDQIRIAGY
jgi:D-beta-D-heptose 7-phosphate kinase/D-beta-D-heptose 1-phosphate adenosyltransferase